MDTTKWDELKTWLQGQYDTAKALADPHATPDTYAYAQALARRDTLRETLDRLDLIELKPI